MRTIGKAIAILLLGYAMAAAQLPSSCCDMSMEMSGDCLAVGCYDCIAAPSAALPSHVQPVHAVCVERAPAAVNGVQLYSLMPEVPIPPPKA